MSAHRYLRFCTVIFTVVMTTLAVKSKAEKKCLRSATGEYSCPLPKKKQKQKTKTKLKTIKPNKQASKQKEQKLCNFIYFY